MKLAKRILAPIDFSDPSRDALDVAVDLATHYRAELLLVHVVPVIPSLGAGGALLHESEEQRKAHTDAEQRLAQLATLGTEKGISTRTEVGSANEVGMEIVRIAQHHQTDLIVIATHGMIGWRNVPFGSVADRVVKHAHCAVLVLRAEHRK
ncbi:MAG TPA: universal stress protein [Polyangiaceae bacterium]|nr:universal stress protein [Polyangiaceae bacterium]